MVGVDKCLLIFIYFCVHRIRSAKDLGIYVIEKILILIQLFFQKFILVWVCHLDIWMDLRVCQWHEGQGRRPDSWCHLSNIMSDSISCDNCEVGKSLRLFLYWVSITFDNNCREYSECCHYSPSDRGKK